VCFITVAWSMRGPYWVATGAPALALAALWLGETFRPECDMTFAHTPRPHLLLAAAGAVIAFVYPGYSGDLPAFIFAPLGVLIAPTLMLGLSLIVAVDSRRARLLAAAHVLAGLVFGLTTTVGDPTARGGVGGLILLALSVLAALTALGRVRMRESDDVPRETSIEQMRAHLYQRRTLLPGPRDPRRGSGRFGRRR
jgi:hypothetical protein